MSRAFCVLRIEASRVSIVVSELWGAHMATKKSSGRKSAGRKSAGKKSAKKSSRGGAKKSASKKKSASVKKSVGKKKSTSGKKSATRTRTTVRRRAVVVDHREPVVRGPVTLSGVLGQGPVFEVPENPVPYPEPEEEVRTVVTRRVRRS
jgi:hypothetical protein